MGNSKNKVSVVGSLAIFSLYLIYVGVAAVTPALAKMAIAFPDHNFVLISTMPTLTLIPASLWAGTVVGKKVKYRTMSIVACLLFVVGGTVPAFAYSNFYGIIFWRAVFGVGLGLLAPLGNALVLGLYQGQKQAAYLGYGTLVMNFGAIIMQMAGGAFAEIKWNYTFYSHLIGIISLVLVLFLPEPEKREEDSAALKTEKKEKMSPAVYVIGLLFFLQYLVHYPVLVNTSLIFEMKHAGGATMAATALSLYTVGGCIAGIVFGTVFKKLKRYSIPLSYILCGIGAFGIYIGKGAVSMMVAATILGFAFYILFPAGYTILGMRTPASTATVATSVCTALFYLGGFLSTYWLNLLKAVFGENIYSPLIIESILLVVLGIIFFIFNPMPRQTEQQE